MLHLYGFRPPILYGLTRSWLSKLSSIHFIHMAPLPSTPRRPLEHPNPSGLLQTTYTLRASNACELCRSLSRSLLVRSLQVRSHGEGRARREEQGDQGVADLDSQEGQDRDALRIHPPHHLHWHEHGAQAPALAALEPRVARCMADSGRQCAFFHHSVVASSEEERSVDSCWSLKT